VFQKLDEQIFGRWQDRSIESVLKLDRPGTYFLSAKAYGFKGLVGGYHSWIVHVDAFKRQYVIEITSRESLKVQGATWWLNLDSDQGDVTQTLYISNRDGGQRWFGSTPEIWLELHMVNLNLLKLLKLLKEYPEMGHSFHFLNRNCNTFISWATATLNEHFRLKLHLPAKTFWGAKNQRYWQKRYVRPKQK